MIAHLANRPLLTEAWQLLLLLAAGVLIVVLIHSRAKRNAARDTDPDERT
jgi:hypothetical protein